MLFSNFNDKFTPGMNPISQKVQFVTNKRILAKSVKLFFGKDENCNILKITTSLKRSK